MGFSELGGFWNSELRERICQRTAPQKVDIPLSGPSQPSPPPLLPSPSTRTTLIRQRLGGFLHGTHLPQAARPVGRAR